MSMSASAERAVFGSFIAKDTSDFIRSIEQHKKDGSCAFFIVYASWCGFCKLMASHFPALADAVKAGCADASIHVLQADQNDEEDVPTVLRSRLGIDVTGFPCMGCVCGPRVIRLNTSWLRPDRSGINAPGISHFVADCASGKEKGETSEMSGGVRGGGRGRGVRRSGPEMSLLPRRGVGAKKPAAARGRSRSRSRSPPRGAAKKTKRVSSPSPIRGGGRAAMKRSRGRSSSPATKSKSKTEVAYASASVLSSPTVLGGKSKTKSGRVLVPPRRLVVGSATLTRSIRAQLPKKSGKKAKRVGK